MFGTSGELLSAALSHSSSGILAQTSNATTATMPLAPTAILALCIAAGIGTVLLLPGRREGSIRKVGGAVLIATALVFVALLVRTFGNSTAGGIGPYFWIFSAIALVGAVRVVTHSRPVYSALYFVMTVFASAGLFVLLQAEFMAAALILIYAGAILVTYVFVIMLAAEAAPTALMEKTGKGQMMGLAEHDTVSREPFAAAVIGFTLMGVLMFLIFDKAQGITPVPAMTETTPIISGSTQELGAYLFKNQIANLELAGLILTIAMVGAIVIARKRVIGPATVTPETPETVIGPATPVDDNPHSIPVYGTMDHRQKAFPET